MERLEPEAVGHPVVTESWAAGAMEEMQQRAIQARLGLLIQAQVVAAAVEIKTTWAGAERLVGEFQPALCHLQGQIIPL